MEQLAAIEQSLAKAFKDLPHFPKGLRDWVGENAWWIVIISVVLGGISVVTTLFAATLFGPFLVGYAGSVGGVATGGAVLLSGLVSVAVLVVTVVLEAMAIQPLKAKRKRGWDLIFLAWLVSFAGSVVSTVISTAIGGSSIFGAVSGLVWTAFFAAIGAYVLFEFRSYYLTPKPVDPAGKPKS